VAPVAIANGVLRACAGAALAVSGVVMFAQVIARYAFDAPFYWAEELATLLFSWVIFLGAAAVQRDDSHLSVDSVRAYAGPRVGWLLDLLRRLVIIACCAVLVWQGIALSERTWPIMYPAMDVTRSLLYMSVPIGALFSLVFAVRAIVLREPPARGVPLDD
jgi:TRAP-type C4-dicarboxylate transport system permease small subunit